MPADMKEGLSSTRKPDTTHVRGGIMRYIARACEWGSVKYERSNFLRPSTANRQEPQSTRADFERLRAYLRAALSHITDTLDSMDAWQAIDPQLNDIDGMRRAAYAEDTDSKPGCPHGHSGLPHLANAAASLMMAIEQATVYGLLPRDPGQPWEDRRKSEQAADESYRTQTLGPLPDPDRRIPRWLIDGDCCVPNEITR